MPVPAKTMPADVAKITESMDKVKVSSGATAILEKITADASSADARHKAVAELVAFVQKEGIKSAFTKSGVLSTLKSSLDAKSAAAVTGSLEALSALSKALGAIVEPYFFPLMPTILEKYGDKDAGVRTAAEATADQFLSSPSRFAFKHVLPALLHACDSSHKWQTKQGALNLISHSAKTHPELVVNCLTEIVPVVSASMWDTKVDIQKAATETMTDACNVVGNPDIIPALPNLIGCINNPEKVPDTIHMLASTTFVTTVEAPTLAIMTPLLERGLNERSPAILRQTAIIIDNMCKLVENPADAHQFLPKLMPKIEYLIDTGADPELRKVAGRAKATLIRVGGGESFNKSLRENKTFEVETAEKVLVVLNEQLAKAAPSVKLEEFGKTSIHYVAELIAEIVALACYQEKDWQQCMVPYLSVFYPKAAAESVCKTVMNHYHEIQKKRDLEMEDQDDSAGELLCNCEFSLAYGGMILLNNTRMRLRRGQRYGLVGHNGCGKSTLLRSINQGKVDGFPSADVLRTVFVEHNLQAEEADLGVAEFVHGDATLASMSRKAIEDALKEVGFSDEMLVQPVGSLSGGWKMKVELARAMLMNADILLLDEPTNHLDVSNVAWLENYLNSLSNVTSIIVSHDSKFLDNVCTNIIHISNRKMRTYKGNLSAFVEIHPEAQSFYELGSSVYQFKLPEPGFLDGVNSKAKAILKLINITYTYPSTGKTAVKKASCQCSLASRIAVIGKNGAGKSTLIKVLTGEVVPNDGEVTKHPNLRVAYVAQHAFHHIESHLDKTPNEYIRWRYQHGEDRELLEKETRKLSKEDEAQMMKKVEYEGEKRQIEGLFGRRKAKKSFEYEVKWIGMPHDENAWISREDLEDWGFQKIVQAWDDKEAANAGSWTRALTALNVQKHLEDLGLEAEFSTHRKMRGLSGGQKVKVVLGAAMWLHPHLLVLDEPTNYLDRDSLGALAEAIKEFGGGVVIISHSREFTEAVCTETWFVEDGVLTIKGQVPQGNAEKLVQQEAETVTDAFGNVTKVKSTRKLTRKEQKQKEKKKALAAKNGQAISSDEDDD